MSLRTWTRSSFVSRGVALGALLAGGALLGAAPATAAPVEESEADLGVSVDGATIAAGASGKDGLVSITNHGPGAASGVAVVVDLGDLDTAKVELTTFGVTESGGGCAPTAGETELRCEVAPEAIDAGAEIDFAFVLERRSDATGPAGSLTFTVEHAGTDPAADNDTATVEVSIEGRGADLGVFADDVYAVDDAGNVTDEPVPPGAGAPLIVALTNQGDETARNITASVRLPGGVRFDRDAIRRAPQDYPPCEFAAGGRTAACELEGLVLVPRDEDQDADDEIWSGISFALPLTVDGAAEAGPAVGGTVTVQGASATGPSTYRAQTPAGVREWSAEVDASDNTDRFTVFVAPSASGGAGGGLPVTGAPAGSLAGAGAATALFGAVLVWVSRRRVPVSADRAA